MMNDNITAAAALIGDPTRAAILIALIDGRAHSAGELATIAKVTPQTASAHLTKLLEGNLIAVEVQGRHRYYRLAHADVAKALESLAALSPPAPVRSLRQSNQAQALSSGRTCYDHIAGKLGVGLTQAFVYKGYLDELEEGYILTAHGKEWLERLGIKTNSKHKIIPYHIDWTERVRHLAGPVAVEITKKLFELKWIVRGEIRRSVRLTDAGRSALHNQLDVNL
ncbi:DNA-binding transcriptional ArsR family regulator [Paenibacillus favisporus]|uniref:DNA-binding transcriptional ArsR family regulator n=1 Tax=Paenibacillus favisporus TaxID=221028 RepID=A0ABV2EZ94_9BACL